MKTKQIALALSLIIGSQTALAQESTKSLETLSLKFYPLGEFGFAASSIHSSFDARANIQTIYSAGGGFGGGGQQGGGLGGGGGFFSVPTVAQIGETGVHTSPTNDSTWNSSQARVRISNDAHADMMHLITSHIATDSWLENGGEATITAVNNTLLITQSDATHKKISEFLKQLHHHAIGGQPLTIELWWLPLDEDQRLDLANQLKLADGQTTLSQLCNATNGYHGTLNGRNRVAGIIRSGHDIRVIAGKVPVVGTGAYGLQPIVAQEHSGITAELTPRILEPWEGQGIQLVVQTEITDLREFEAAETSSGDIDRYQLGRHSLQADCICPVNKPQVVGSLSAVGISAESSDNQKEIMLVAQISDSGKVADNGK